MKSCSGVREEKMNEDDLRLVFQGIKKGDEGDFKAFFHAYFPRLLYYACRFVDKETGEDIVQDVFHLCVGKPGKHRHGGFIYFVAV